MREDVEQELELMSNSLMKTGFYIRSFKPRRAATLSYNVSLYLTVCYHIFFSYRVDTLLSEYAWYCPYC